MTKKIRTIAYMGMPRLRQGLAALDVNVVDLGFARNLNTCAPLGWDEITSACHGTPDAFIYADMSCPPPVLGMERFPCPTVFYCIDSHIHSWYPDYAQGFDLCAVSLKDHLPAFGRLAGLRLTDEQLLWLPPTHGPQDVPAQMEKQHGVIFVGTVDKELTPGRYVFLREFAKHVDVHITRGAYTQLFPTAQVVLNIAERGDMNFRIFEALGCGSCLLTPAIGHGHDELFTDGVHLKTYDFTKNPAADARSAAQAAQQLLANPAACAAMAQAGRAEVEARHTVQHRARTVLDRLESLNAGTLIAKRQADAHSICARHLRLIYLHWAEQMGNTPAKSAYLAEAVRRLAA